MIHLTDINNLCEFILENNLIETFIEPTKLAEKALVY